MEASALRPLLVALALSLSLALGAEPVAVRALPLGPVVLVNALWTLVFFLTLVYARELAERVRSSAWRSHAAGQLLAVLGMALVFASYLSLPVSAFEGSRAAIGLKSALLFAMAVSGFLFLVEWCTVIGLRPSPFAPATVHYLLPALALTGAATLLPAAWHPVVEVTEATMTFPAVAGAALSALALYLAASSLLLVRRTPAPRRFVWQAAYSLLLVLLLAATLAEAASLPRRELERSLGEGAVYLYGGAALLVGGLALQVRAQGMFVRSFFLQGRAAPCGATGRDATEHVLSLLLARFVDTGPAERAVRDAVRAEGALASLELDLDGRRVGLDGVDLSDERALAGISRLFFRLVELLEGAGPPLADRPHTREGLRRDIKLAAGPAAGQLPPAVRGFLMERGEVVAQGVALSLERLLALAPPELMGGTVEEALAGVWGEGAVSRSPRGPSVDAEALARAKPDELEESYLSMYRRVCASLERAMGRARLEEDVRSALGPVSSDPLYAASGASDLFANALLAGDHTWGTARLDEQAGRLDARFSVLVLHGAGFAKELLCARLVGANLRAYRNAVWVSQSSPSTLEPLLRGEGGVEPERLWRSGRLASVAIDPRAGVMREAAPGRFAVGSGVGDVVAGLASLLRSQPPSGTVAALELPISALEGGDLYRELYHLKAACEERRVLLVVVANERTLTPEARSVLQGMCETVASAEGSDTLKILPFSGGRRVEVRLV